VESDKFAFRMVPKTFRYRLSADCEIALVSMRASREADAH